MLRAISNTFMRATQASNFRSMSTMAGKEELACNISRCEIGVTKLIEQNKQLTSELEQLEQQKQLLTSKMDNCQSQIAGLFKERVDYIREMDQLIIGMK